MKKEPFTIPTSYNLHPHQNNFIRFTQPRLTNNVKLHARKRGEPGRIRQLAHVFLHEAVGGLSEVGVARSVGKTADSCGK